MVQADEHKFNELNIPQLVKLYIDNPSFTHGDNVPETIVNRRSMKQESCELCFLK